MGKSWSFPERRPVWPSGQKAVWKEMRLVRSTKASSTQGEEQDCYSKCTERRKQLLAVCCSLAFWSRLVFLSKLSLDRWVQVVSEKYEISESRINLLFSRSVVSNSFAIPCTIACQAPLSMGFPRQEYWRGLPIPCPGDLPHSGIEPSSPALAGRFFTTEPLGEHKVSIAYRKIHPF